LYHCFGASTAERPDVAASQAAKIAETIMKKRRIVVISYHLTYARNLMAC